MTLHEASKKYGDFATDKMEAAAKVDLLDYLIEVAMNTEGADVWRALFAEIKRNLT